MNSIEKKAQIIRSGNSKVFINWQKLLPNLTEEMFLAAVKWVCEDPAEEGEKLTREIGLTRIGIVKLNRHNLKNGMTEIRHENGRLWTGDVFRVPCDNPDYADENRTIKQNLKLSLSARDHV